MTYRLPTEEIQLTFVFVSDQVRTEFSPKGVSFKIRSAREEMTKFTRTEGFRAPILIFTTNWSVLTV